MRTVALRHGIGGRGRSGSERATFSARSRLTFHRVEGYLERRTPPVFSERRSRRSLWLQSFAGCECGLTIGRILRPPAPRLDVWLTVSPVLPWKRAGKNRRSVVPLTTASLNGAGHTPVRVEQGRDVPAG